MIKVHIFDPYLIPLDAQLYISNENMKKVLVNTKCWDGYIEIDEPFKLTDDTELLIRVRYCTMTYCLCPIEFSIFREGGEDLEFCIKMNFDGYKLGL